MHTRTVTASRRGLPLGTLVTSAMVVLLLAASGTVAVSAFFTMRTSVAELWRSLSSNLVARTTNEALVFLGGVEGQARVTVDLIASGVVDPTDEAALVAHLARVLDANPNFTWVGFGDPRGTYVAAMRWPREGGGVEIRQTVRHSATPEALTPPYEATLKDAVRQPDGSWRPLPVRRDRYDPRQRVWYREASKLPAGQGLWTDPYLFMSRLQPGVTHARPIRDAAGTLLGVLTVDLESKPLSEFLETLRVGERGRVYILDRQGNLVGHPRGEFVGEDAQGKPTLRSADAHPDEMLAGGWREMRARGLPRGDALTFEFGDYLAMARPFPSDTGIPWLVLTVVPEADFFGTARAEAQLAAGIIGGVLVLVLLLGLWLSRGLTRRIGELRAEMRRIAHFDLSDARFADAPSAIRELNEMSAATDNMKQGLRSFSRYVPYQLVDHLLRSGREAKLGAEREELTILFADIAGFTPIVESTAPDVVLQALGEYLEAMNVEIATTEGTVCQYLGDEIMAFWGAPEHQHDHALRACRGALRMRAKVHELIAAAPEKGLPALRTRFGINSGDVMVGNIGAPQRFNYGILGDPVNTAARLQGLNKVFGTEMIVGPRTAELVGDALVLRPLDWVRVKGKREPLAVVELVCEPADLDADTRAIHAGYAQALELYKAGDFEAALAGFEALEGDPPAAVMASRCRHNLEHPPEPGTWDGVFVMKTK